MAKSEERDKEEKRGWFAAFKDWLGIALIVLVIALVVAMFVLGDLIVGPR